MSCSSGTSTGSLRSALVLVFDRLGASFLGPYGNTWLETPAWNRLAAESALWENCLADSPDLATVYRSYWHGIHAAAVEDLDANSSVVVKLGELGVQTVLVTDEARVLQHPLSRGFSQIVEIAANDGNEPCSDIPSCQVVRFVSRLLTILETIPRPFLCWAHCRGMQGAWDAPLEMRSQFREDGDPAPYAGTEPPRRSIPIPCDPDSLFPWVQAYAAQVAVADIALGNLLDYIDGLSREDRDNEIAIAVTSPRGFPLGEHGQIGEVECPLLRNELLQLPLIWRSPHCEQVGWRFQDLIQPPDLAATLLDWFGLTIQPSRWGRNLLQRSHVERSLAVSVTATESVVRTPVWMLCSTSEAAQLFVKPDDRHEVNDVANRCPQIVDQLGSTLTSFRNFASAHERDQLPPLPDELMVSVD